jgi:hypothetical protein
MTAGQLIEKLQKAKPEAEVYLSVWGIDIAAAVQIQEGSQIELMNEELAIHTDPEDKL